MNLLTRYQFTEYFHLQAIDPASITGLCPGADDHSLLLCSFEDQLIRYVNLETKNTKIVYRTKRRPRCVLRLHYRASTSQAQGQERIALIEMENANKNVLVIARMIQDGTYTVKAADIPVQLPESSSSSSGNIVELPGGSLLCACYNFKYLHEIIPSSNGPYSLYTQHPLPSLFRSMCTYHTPSGIFLLLVGLDDNTVRCMQMGNDVLDELIRINVRAQVYRMLSSNERQVFFFCKELATNDIVDTYTVLEGQIHRDRKDAAAAAADSKRLALDTQIVPKSGILDRGIARKVCCWTILPSRHNALMVIDVNEASILHFQ